MAFADFGSGVSWSPSVQLRWFVPKIGTADIIKINGVSSTVKILQQLWISSEGKTEWRDIPTEKESK